MNKKMIHLVPQSEHDSALQNMGDRLESKMNSAFQEFETMINNMMQKTEKRIDKFDEQLKNVFFPEAATACKASQANDRRPVCWFVVRS